MKFVFLTSLVPVKAPKSGYDIANRVLVDGLRALGHDVKIIGFLTPGDQPAYPSDTIVLDELEVTNSRVSQIQKLKWLAKAFVLGTPVSVAKMHAVDARKIEHLLSELRPFDGLVLNSVQLPGAFFEQIKDENNIFIAHNVEHKSAQKNALAAKGMFSTFLFNREANLIAKTEKVLCDNACHVFTLADQDRHDLKIAHKSTALSLITKFENIGFEPSQNPTYDIGLIGSWSWAANRQGLDWFLQHVVPSLPQDFTIAIAGSIGQKPQVTHKNLQFVGRVDDANEFIGSCRTIPLISREGTGVQLKTIETFELGMPTVATVNSLRGLQHIPENCTIADLPSEYVAALIKTVEDARTSPLAATHSKDFHQRQKADFLAGLHAGVCQLQPEKSEEKVA